MRTTMRPRLTAAALPPLPPGYVPAAPHRRTAARPEPPTRPTPAVSGVLMTVTAACGCPATLHRGGYDIVSPRGGWTVHGYAWRCTHCRRTTVGYPAAGFGRAHRDAHTHQCEVHCG